MKTKTYQIEPRLAINAIQEVSEYFMLTMVETYEFHFFGRCIFKYKSLPSEIVWSKDIEFLIEKKKHLEGVWIITSF